MTALTSLAGLRILVVEDDMMIALHVEEALRDFGCIVIGPVGRLDVALQLASVEVFDAAILDVTIRGGQVFPVAERLMSRGIPFVFASGYGDWALPDAFRNQPRLTKPFTIRDLEARVRAFSSAPRAIA
ncbi:MAG: response regulator [Janthinobacterium lividum]